MSRQAMVVRARLRAPGWIRKAYRAAHAFMPAPVSLPIPSGLVEDCQVCATRQHLVERLPRGGVVAELGTLRGDFARHIVKTGDPRELHLIDVTFSRFDHTGLTGAQVRCHQGNGHEVIAGFADSYFDWVYIDADHSYAATLRDARAAAPKIKPGGFMVFNDFAHIDPDLGRYGVHRAVSEFAREHRWPVAFFAFNAAALYDIALQRPSL